MRYIVIQDCNKDVFSEIRDAYIEYMPFALFTAIYSKTKRKAVFGFWGDEYIVKPLKKYTREIQENQSLLIMVGNALHKL